MTGAAVGVLFTVAGAAAVVVAAVWLWGAAALLVCGLVLVVAGVTIPWERMNVDPDASTRPTSPKIR